MKDYYNTTRESGGTLLNRKHKALSQQYVILSFFRFNQEYGYTPLQVKFYTGTKAPITSVRRAMTNLTDAGFLEKTNIRKMEEYGAYNYTWKYRRG